MSNEDKMAGDNIEKRVAKRRQRQNIQDIVLAGIYVASAMGLTMVAPNTLQLLKYVEKYIGPKKNLDRRIGQAMSRLRAKGLINSKNELSAGGRKNSESFIAFEKILPRKQIRWDKKWRIVIFDVWEKRRAVRDRLRISLQEIGFIKVQDSVWVYPYPCEEIFAYLRSTLRLGRGVLYIVADEIENDQEIRKYFKLPLH